MFWGPSVMDGHSHNVCLRNNEVKVVVVVRREWGFDAKSTTMDVNKERKLLGRVGSDFGEVDSSRYTRFLRDCDVFGLDSSYGICGGWNGFCAEEPLDTAVFVDTDEGRKVMGYFVCVC